MVDVQSREPLASPLGKRKDAVQVYAEGRVTALLDEFDIEVEDKCNFLKQQAAELATSVRNQLAIELVKIPKRIREMPMKTFMEEYGGDLNIVIEDDMRKQIERSTPMLTSRKSNVVLPSETPTRSSSTSSRIQHRRLPSTVGGAPPSSKGLSSSRSKILLQGDDGQTIDLTDKCLLLQQQLSAKDRKDALVQLKQLHEQVEALLSTYTQ
jgi:hypothetical protein